MDTRNAFNLNSSLDSWKSELSLHSMMTRDNIDELESHLHDEMFELQKSGLSVEESMLVA